MFLPNEKEPTSFRVRKEKLLVLYLKFNFYKHTLSLPLSLLSSVEARSSKFERARENKRGVEFAKERKEGGRSKIETKRD